MGGCCSAKNRKWGKTDRKTRYPRESLRGTQPPINLILGDSMLIWEDADQIAGWKKINHEIEIIGAPARHFMPGHERIQNVWTQSYKAWEYPFLYLWLQNLSLHLGLTRKLIVMDFGCGRSVFPQFLATKGFDVWGIDNDQSNFISPIWAEMNKFYPNVDYWIGDIFDFNYPIKFDAIISSSVLEHIVPAKHRINTVKRLQSLLRPGGKQAHVVDYYFPECPGSRINIYEFNNALGFPIEDLQRCPGAPGFTFQNIRPTLNMVHPNNPKPQARIAIGDDV